MYFEKY